MGKQGKWFSAVKKAFRSPSKEDKKANLQVASPEAAAATTVNGDHKKPSKEKRRWSFGKQHSRVSNGGKYSHPPLSDKFPGDAQRAIAVTEADEAKQHSSAIRIQTAFRGYLARRSLRALRGLVRLQAFVREDAGVKRQATITLRCVQALVRVQARVRARRVRMSEEGQAVQRHLWQRRQAPANSSLVKPRKSISDSSELNGWNDSVRTVKELQAKEQNKQEAALKRERALSYALSHSLWRGSAKDNSQLFVDCEGDKSHWDWNWLEIWISARPWENRVNVSKDLVEEASKQSTNDENAKILDESVQQNSSKQNGTKQPASVAGSIRDDESLASSPAVPNYMQITQSARNKVRCHSMPKQRPDLTPEKDTTPARKRLSFPISSRLGTRPPEAI